MDDFREQLQQNLYRIRGHAQRICGDADRAEDLLQDVAVAYLEHPRQPPTAEYLMSIACNVNKSSRRKARVRRTVNLAEPIEDGNRGPMREAERSENLKCLQLALTKLNDDELKLAIALWWDDKPYTVAAQELGLRLNGMKSKRFRLLAKIKSSIGIRNLASV